MVRHASKDISEHTDQGHETDRNCLHVKWVQNSTEAAVFVEFNVYLYCK
jgi:hypothetical protein